MSDFFFFGKADGNGSGERKGKGREEERNRVESSLSRNLSFPLLLPSEKKNFSLSLSFLS